MCLWSVLYVSKKQQEGRTQWCFAYAKGSKQAQRINTFFACTVSGWVVSHDPKLGVVGEQQPNKVSGDSG